ncbi:hypothetical protein GYMLUDRAFT_57074 [Collybiopsis luxurians FD-317 M1]|uniref:Uncharacterized protein n=1 Tax=Collybiopsis luxurians FD-317 M1 TaxID=944289 RepID=A0A0D0C7B8_9AGAR|nr:hypothetical protein GYMLUDRAFT_57074 [Collybiopsis luxurians FD-317 M1]
MKCKPSSLNTPNKLYKGNKKDVSKNRQNMAINSGACDISIKDEDHSESAYNPSQRQQSDSETDDIVDTTATETAKKEVPRKIKKDLARQKAPIYAFFHVELEIEFAKDKTAKYLVYTCTNCG